MCVWVCVCCLAILLSEITNIYMIIEPSTNLEVIQTNKKKSYVVFQMS